MFLFLSWNYFVIYNSIVKINSLDFIITSSFMLFLTFSLNIIQPVKIKLYKLLSKYKNNNKGNREKDLQDHSNNNKLII